MLLLIVGHTKTRSYHAGFSRRKHSLISWFRYQISGGWSGTGIDSLPTFFVFSLLITIPLLHCGIGADFPQFLQLSFVNHHSTVALYSSITAFWGVQQSSPGTIPDFQVGGFVSDQALGCIRSKGVSLALSYFPYFEKKLRFMGLSCCLCDPPRNRNGGDSIYVHCSGRTP